MPTADAAEIEAAYATKSQSLVGDAHALSLLRVAYDTLRNPQSRAAYDRKLAQRQDIPPAPAITIAESGSSEDQGSQRTSLRNIAVLLLAAAGTASYFVLQTPKTPATAPASPPPAASTDPVASAPPMPSPATEPQESASTAPTGERNDVASEPAAAIAGSDAAQPAAALPTRGAKQPGFDAQYVAWSVFTIRQRNLTGSGVMIGADRILTNCHVLAGGATNGLIVVHGLTKRITKVEKYARLDGEDACLLYAPGAGDASIDWGSAASLRAGDTVHAMGHPGGSSDIVWSEGRFHQRAERGGETFLITDNYCRPGSSGGPLLDNEGRLVGVVTAVQRYQAKGGQLPQFGACISVTESTARALLSKPLFPIALAPAKYIPNY
jgi:S1-C subfamily serine protease